VLKWVCASTSKRAVEKRARLIAVMWSDEKQSPNSLFLHVYIIYIYIRAFCNLITSHSVMFKLLADEPVWSIGTGLVCPKEVAQEVHAFIRSIIAKKYGSEVANKVIIQYGGSVKPDNVKALMEQPDIDGCLVGGASLTADSFAKIVRYKDQ
jgi:triosephosphate isomerase (TIM)